ncbi:TATA box-binding protein-associated factor RNA polymerase I subunit B, partial [Medicago truncatula]
YQTEVWLLLVYFPAIDDIRILKCQNYLFVGYVDDSDDGFFYCPKCNVRFDGVFDNDVDDVIDVYILRFRRKKSAAIKAEPNSQPCSEYDAWSKFVNNLLEDETQQNDDIHIIEQNIDGTSVSHPSDFGSSKHKTSKYYHNHNQIRMRHLMGLQMMIELQCKALVKEFKVTPLICGLVGPIWLRFISKTGVFDDDRAYTVMHNSEMQKEGEPEDYTIRGKYREEPHNMFGQRFVMIWLRYLKNRIPLACTIAVSYLACHIARKPSYHQT